MLGNHFRPRSNLGAGNIVHLKDVISFVTRIDGSRVDRLGINHGRADDQANRDGELHNDQRRAKPAGARCFRCRAVSLENVGGLEPGNEEGRIKTAEQPDDDHYADSRKQDSVRSDIIERKPGIEEGSKRTNHQLHQRQRHEHRNDADQKSLTDELDNELLAIGSEHFAKGHLPRALAGPGSSQISEVHDRHSQDEDGNDREGRDGAPVISRRH